MGVSKNRKGHAKKSAQRTLINKRIKEKSQRELMEMFKNMQQAKDNETPNVVGVEELGNIGDNLEL